MVAGILQTLSFRPQTAGNGVFQRRVSHSLASAVRLSGHFLVPLSPSPSLSEKSHRIPCAIRAVGGSDQADGSGGQFGSSGWKLSWARPLVDFAASNFLPLALVSGISLGLANPAPGCLAQKYSLSKFSTFGIFVISGLMLRSGDIGAAAEAWPAGMFGLLAPQEFVTGLAIFSCMPTTLSSGVTLTQLVGGNSALALAVTVLSNLLGILIVPFSLSKLIGQGSSVSIPTTQLLKSLIITLLVPLILGKVLRDSFNSVAEYVDQNRKHFSMTSAILLSIVPWIQVSRSRFLLLSVKPAVFLSAIGMGVLLHLILLMLNSLVVQSLSVVFGNNKPIFSKKENARAVVIVASQKTLPVMVAVVEQLGGVLGESGLLVLPCVAAHINQIIIDSFLVNVWLRNDRLSTTSKEA